MMDIWREADEEETEDIIENIAQKIVAREMELPAHFVLGTFRPVAYIGGQMARFFLAGLTPLLGDMRYEYISVLEKPSNVSKIIRRINELSDEREEQKKHERDEKKKNQSDKKRKWHSFFKKN